MRISGRLRHGGDGRRRFVAHQWGDEGMWTFDNLPLKQLKERYGFEPTPLWIARVRSAAVRFNSGGSGSFVSADGLVMTNHHVAGDTLQKISSPAKDYFKDGFLAGTREQEVKAPDLELNVLAGIEDVTARWRGCQRGDERCRGFEGTKAGDCRDRKGSV